MLVWPVLALATACAQAPTGLEIARALSERAARDATSTLSVNYRKEWKEEEPVDPNTTPDETEWRMTKQKIWNTAGNGYRFTQTTVQDSTGDSPAGRREVKVADARRTFVARYAFKAEVPCIVKDGLLAVRFAPRTDVQLPSGEDEDDLLNHLSGTMYIDTERWYVRSAVGTLTQDFKVKVIGKVTAARVWMEQDDDDGVVVIRAISTEIWAEYRIWPFEKKRQHFRQIYQFFRQPSETTPQVSPLP